MLVEERKVIAKQIERTKSRFWKDIAWRITRPRQNLAEVNLGKLDKLTKDGDTVVVPGKVLANGEIKHKITVAAMGFSTKAKQAIEKAGGKCLSLYEMAKEKPDGNGIRIIG